MVQSNTESKQILAINPIVYINVSERSNFECPICRDQLSEPIYCQSCSNIFCSKCINNWSYLKDTFKCPMCRSEWTSNQTQIIERLNAITKLANDCPEFSYECSFCRYPFVKSTDVKAHLELCKFVSCCKGCKTSFPIKNLQKHLVDSIKCKESYHDFNFECPFCEEGFKGEIEELSNHLESCSYLIKCKPCKKLMLKKDFNHHKTVCEFTPTECQKCK